MYGIIGKMMATEGNREKLIKILLNGTKDMAGLELCPCWLLGLLGVTDPGKEA